MCKRKSSTKSKTIQTRHFLCISDCLFLLCCLCYKSKWWVDSLAHSKQLMWHTSLDRHIGTQHQHYHHDRRFFPSSRKTEKCRLRRFHSRWFYFQFGCDYTYTFFRVFGKKDRFHQRIWRENKMLQLCKFTHSMNGFYRFIALKKMLQ